MECLEHSVRQNNDAISSNDGAKSHASRYTECIVNLNKKTTILQSHRIQ